MDWLKGYRGEIMIPPVVYMEICRQYLDRDRTAEELDSRLNRSSIKVLRFDRNNARMAAELMAGRKDIVCKDCGKIDWADTVVASHINAGDHIITNNKNDFPTSGGFEGKIMTTDELMNRL
ncbi:MAG: PIN domain-containing protein [Methanomassiliicoccaceae archaeon]|nr:PIN domain-containing protein [Methanomassiliicoccaceae archaeon]